MAMGQWARKGMRQGGTAHTGFEEKWFVIG
jgi:hypothetical protein